MTVRWAATIGIELREEEEGDEYGTGRDEEARTPTRETQKMRHDRKIEKAYKRQEKVQRR